MEEKDAIIVAITGGIGSGKSTVAEIIRGMGYQVISTDDLAKSIMSQESILKKLKSKFGNEIFDQEKIIHKKLSDLVFGPTKQHEKNLDILNSIIHPPVIEEMTNQVEKLIINGEKLIFVESALIYEAELEEGFEYVIAVASPEKDSINRIIKRSGLTVEEINWRINSQLPAKVKEDYADFTINNEGTLEELKSATEFIIDILKEISN